LTVMVCINLKHISKAFSGSWLFKDLNIEFAQPSHWVVLGANGSGKSTLLLMLCGFIKPSSGQITWTQHSQQLSEEAIPLNMAYCTPQLMLDEQLTVKEQVEFYFKFKPLKCNESITSVITNAQLYNHRNKAVHELSSGLKQRLKLALAFCSDTPVLCLDEPTSHLDQSGITWYTEALQKYSQNRILIVASNHNPSDFIANSAVIQL